MAASDTHNNHVPAALGGDLSEQEQSALEEAHDADIPSNKGIESEQSRPHFDEPKAEKDADRVSSSVSSRSKDAQEVEQGPTTNDVTEAEKQIDPQDSNIVDWDGPDDPQNPMNWPAAKKWSNIGILSLMTLLVPMASSMFAPGVPDVQKDFHNTNVSLATFVVSVYLLGFAFGPLVLAPLSEMYGRLWIYNVCNLMFVIMTVGCALSRNMNMLIGFRFLAGCFGIATITNGGGTIADVMPIEKRGAAMSIWTIGPLLGPVIGPVAGGFTAQYLGWRWIFWILTIASGAASILFACIARESYAPILLERKTRRLIKETGNTNLRSRLDFGGSPKELWRRSLLRPAKLMFLSVICGLMSLLMAVIYGILYLLFTTFTFVFEDNYGFSQSIVGLVYIGLGVGTMLGLLFLGLTSDRIMKALAKKYSNGENKPEYRLPLLIFTSPLIPIGLFIYGWTVQYKVFWLVPLIGSALVGVGLLMAFMCINTYLIDAFTRYAASAMAANTVLRSIFGAVFPLFALQMYDTLGLGWGNSLIGFVTLALVPIPVLFWIYGERLRTHPKLQVQL